MAKVLHVSMDGSAAQSVAALIAGRCDQRQAIVQDCYAYGPLRDLDRSSCLAARAAWLAPMFKAANVEDWADGFDEHLGLADLALAPAPH